MSFLSYLVLFLIFSIFKKYLSFFDKFILTNSIFSVILKARKGKGMMKMYQKSLPHYISKILVDILFYASIVCTLMVPVFSRQVYMWIQYPYESYFLPFTLIVFVSGIFCVLILYHLKRLFKTLMVGDPFVEGNVVHLHFSDLRREMSVSVHSADLCGGRCVLRGLSVVSDLKGPVQAGSQLQSRKRTDHIGGVKMPIIVNLDVMMAKEKIGLMELAEKVNITPANLSVLKNNKAKAIRFSTLEDICKALSCQPADILEYRPDKEVLQ